MLTVLIEPILMVIIGIVVGGLALSIFMPIYGMIKVI
jgi:type II secretory pathway component PulF